MYIALNDEEIKKLEEIKEITMTDVFNIHQLYSVNDIFSLMCDLLCEYHKLQEKLEDIEKDIDENYQVKERDLYDEYGVSVNDF